uniref:Axin dorsalization-associated isoform x1 n=1 Tax=Tetraselmis sp. GSL018 TaxID=582737 RepID=A0A061RHQ3_9CHLO
MEDMDVLRRKWERCFSEALEFDTWGQVEEASEGYARLRLSLQNTLQDAHQELTPQSRKNLESLAQCLLMRGKELDSGKDEGVGVHGMKLVTGFIRSVMEDEGPFPIRLRDAPPLPTIVPATDAVQETEGGTLLPPQSSSRSGDEFLQIKVDRWGFKDASGFIDPFVSMHVVDGKGNHLEDSQDTPVTNRYKPHYVMFGNTFHVQTPTNALPKDTGIVFEFRHYKPKKKKVSVRAWAFLELREIVEGPIASEVYKKPTDLKRKKFSLLTVKELYLHLDCKLRLMQPH